LERRRKSTAPQPTGGQKKTPDTNAPTSSLPDLPFFEETIEHGGISIGIIPPLKEFIAVAHEGRNTLAMLKRLKVNLWHIYCPGWISPSPGPRQTTFSLTRLTSPQTRNAPSIPSRRPETIRNERLHSSLDSRTEINPPNLGA